MAERAVGVRWTVGDVSDAGFEALRLSVHGACRVFGPEAAYAVCVNGLGVAEARRRCGAVPDGVAWRAVTAADLPPRLTGSLDGAMAEGVAWKLAPLRAFPDRWELSLDNDCVLWALPDGIARWLEGDAARAVALAEDVEPAFGAFAPLCGERPLNTGIRGFAPGFDLEERLGETLRGFRGVLGSELDEQGMQVAALVAHGDVSVVSTEDVSICSPFWPRQADLGRCGAHFVGLNPRHIPWNYYDRPGDEWQAEFWARHRPEVYARVGLAPVS